MNHRDARCERRIEGDEAAPGGVGDGRQHPGAAHVARFEPHPCRAPRSPRQALPAKLVDGQHEGQARPARGTLGPERGARAVRVNQIEPPPPRRGKARSRAQVELSNRSAVLDRDAPGPQLRRQVPLAGHEQRRGHPLVPQRGQQRQQEGLDPGATDGRHHMGDPDGCAHTRFPPSGLPAPAHAGSRGRSESCPARTSSRHHRASCEIPARPTQLSPVRFEMARAMK